MASPDFPARIDAVRRFNRFYSAQIDLLVEGLLKSPFSLAEARLILEIGNRGVTTAAGLGSDLHLDLGYLSRMFQRLEKRGLIERRPAEPDPRLFLIRLSAAGEAAYGLLDGRSRELVGALLRGLSAAEQNRLVKAMQSIETLLAMAAALPGAGASAQGSETTPFTIRTHRPGDLGWIVSRHGALYAEEYGWDQRFEALVATIAAEFIQNFDPARERCWIAERNGRPVGSVALVKQSERVAKLRILLVEPTARGLGIGERLVDECIQFARHAGYQQITLWTMSILHAARHIYEKAGFTLVHEQPEESFGQQLTAQTWELKL